jgi:hypothetical protein
MEQDGYRSDHPEFALPTRVSSVLEGGQQTRQFEPSIVVFALIFLG